LYTAALTRPAFEDISLVYAKFKKFSVGKRLPTRTAQFSPPVRYAAPGILSIWQASRWGNLKKRSCAYGFSLPAPLTAKCRVLTALCVEVNSPRTELTSFARTVSTEKNTRVYQVPSTSAKERANWRWSTSDVQ